ncbi:MAG: DUF4885 family protein [Lachnospiraceae bacterium]|nr:DUF4885 family protein [Lachnospiraceae bacterium]
MPYSFTWSNPVIESRGSGYYNYYNLSNRKKVDTPNEVWYKRDLSATEISNNNNIPSKDSDGADMYRKLEEIYAPLAESNRARYSDYHELQCALEQKYRKNNYPQYSDAERKAMYACELNMTCFGIIGTTLSSGYVKDDPHLKGEVKAASNSTTKEYNEKTLSQQFRNVFINNGLDISLFGNARFSFAVNGMTKRLSVYLLENDEDNPVSDSLIKQMEQALNTGKNAGNLFYNMLHNASAQKLLKEDERAKYLLYSDFYEKTGLDIRDFTQTEDGFVNSEGQNARELYKQGLKDFSIRSEFKNVAYDYFLILERDAMRYDISKIPDLALSMNYQSGSVRLEGAESFDYSA